MRLDVILSVTAGISPLDTRNSPCVFSKKQDIVVKVHKATRNNHTLENQIEKELHIAAE
jgi:hypothetical protein